MIQQKTVNGETMVWKMRNGVAICADIEQHGAGGYIVRFRDKKEFFFTKKDALYFARKWVKEAI